MPDAAGKIKGAGWSRKRAAGWDRAFGSKPLSPETLAVIQATTAPTSPDELADRCMSMAPLMCDQCPYNEDGAARCQCV